ncbi:MAG: hypothetical protein WCZ29_28120 [Mycolicibacterium vanbaalenii]|uniref:hypothetical protein n=1 Tax=Mycolicibacterium vanbaalenii TaxID=110539 RepID=UPI0035627139
MKNFTIATAVAAGLTAAALGLAGPAVAAPSATGDAQSTISELQAGGNRVIVNKLGSAPLSEAEVVGCIPAATSRNGSTRAATTAWS